MTISLYQFDISVVYCAVDMHYKSVWLKVARKLAWKSCNNSLQLWKWHIVTIRKNKSLFNVMVKSLTQSISYGAQDHHWASTQGKGSSINSSVNCCLQQWVRWTWVEILVRIEHSRKTQNHYRKNKQNLWPDLKNRKKKQFEKKVIFKKLIFIILVDFHGNVSM